MTLPTPNFDTPATIDDLMAHVLDFGAVCAAHGTPDSNDGCSVRRAAAQVIDAMLAPRDQVISTLRAELSAARVLLARVQSFLPDCDGAERDALCGDIAIAIQHIGVAL